MGRRVIAHVLACLAVTWTASSAAAQMTGKGNPSAVQSVQDLEMYKLGKSAYERYCIGCHGENGDGQGPAAFWLSPKPRDFTSGVFKFRSTPSGEVPLDEDLYRTITRGVYGTSMPSWSKVPETTRRALVVYVKSFSDEFDGDPPQPIVMPPPPPDLDRAERVKMGRSAYRALGCPQCHGESGGADGPASATLATDNGESINPANFHRGRLRGGRTPTDIYRAIATGYMGTPMPGFLGTLSSDQLWDVVAYIRYVMDNGGDPQTNDVHPPCVIWGTCDPEGEGDAP